MKKCLANGIEQYIKVLIDRSENGQIEIQRAELAETFACVPSQISYVLSTRFTRENGYLTESHRGGQGYVRITRINKDYEFYNNDRLLQLLQEMSREKLLKERESEMLKHIVFNVGANLPLEDKLRVNQEIFAALRNFLQVQAGKEE